MPRTVPPVWLHGVPGRSRFALSGRLTPRLTAFCGAVFVFACGGVVNESNGGQGASGDGGGLFGAGVPGAGGGSSGGEFDGRGGTAAATGGFPSHQATEAGASCRETNDTVHLDVSSSGSLGDAGLRVGNTDQSLNGTIGSVGRGMFTLAECAFANCVGTTWTITIDAPGLDLRNVMYAGNAASVHYVRTAGGAGAGEARDMLVTNPFDGNADGGVSPASILVAADDGGGTLDEAPYQVSFTDACFDSGGTCAGQPPSASVRHDFGLVFVAEGVATTVQMGETAKWDLPGRETLLAVRNLRSFTTGPCAGIGFATRAFWISSTGDCPRCL